MTKFQRLDKIEAKKIAWDESSAIAVTDIQDYFLQRGLENINTKPSRPEPLKPRYAGMYPIPKEIVEATEPTLTGLEMENRIDNVLPKTDDLNEETYNEFFRAVLNLEEIEMMRMIKKYSHKRCILSKGDKFFVYEVQNKLNNTQFLNLGK